MKNRNLLKILSVVLVAGLMVSCMGMEESDPSSLQVPEVKTFDVKDNGSLVFELTASVDKSLAGRIAECGFYYGKDKSLNGAEKIECKNLSGTFSADITLHEYGETFYACSYISNGTEGNEICSEVKKITVKELEDYVEFTNPSLISYDKSSAKVSVDYKAADGVEVTESGVCFGRTESLSLDKGSVKGVDGIAELVDLETGESYYVCYYVKDGDDVAYSKSVPFSVYGIPVVVTGKEPETDSESAALSGAVEDDCGKEVTERGFLWCEGAVEVLDVSRDTKVKCGAGIGEFNHTLTELKPNMTYSFCAYAMNAEGTAYGEVVRFTTGVALPVHGKPVVDDITPFTVVLKANVLSDGGESASEQGFCWGENPNVGNKVKCSGETFSYKLTGLSRNTTYYVKSYSVNKVGTACSEVIEFTTMPELPTVSTEEVSEIAEYSAVCHGAITDDGGAEVTDKGFVYGPTSNPAAQTGTKVSAGQGMDHFSLTLSDLSPNVTYYVRAYAENPAGISYGDQRSFTTKTALPSVGIATLVTSTSTSLTVSASLIDDGGETPSEVGFYYSTSADFDLSSAIKVSANLSQSCFTANLAGLVRATQYYICPFAENSVGEMVGDVLQCRTLAEIPVIETASVTGVSILDAVCGGFIVDNGGEEIISKGLVWSTEPNPMVNVAESIDVGGGNENFTSSIIGLQPSTKYYVRAYATNSFGTGYGVDKIFTTTGALMMPANCFIISNSGSYVFEAVKGNSTEAIGDMSSVVVLWESYGTSIKPSKGKLVKSVKCSGRYIMFETPSSFSEGNALIAAKDSSGKIIWSWHIWLTDSPGECVYENNAGIMMDRNIGATSSTPGDVGAIGLYYQWGRKDPFLGPSSIDEDVEALSTITWPTAVSSSSTTGTIDYSIKHPTTFICSNTNNKDWYYTGDSSTDDTRWQSNKTIYDPCPYGWRVPDGGWRGIWEKADFKNHSYNGASEGISFGLGNSSPTTWYPAAGDRSPDDGKIYGTGVNVYYWSVTSSGKYAYTLNFNLNGYVYPDHSDGKALGAFVRCLKE